VPLTTDPLVSTKLRPSQARPNLVARPRLTARLEREDGRTLTLISAPAGFGKTTLLGEWVAGRSDERHVAWLSLDVLAGAEMAADGLQVGLVGPDMEVHEGRCSRVGAGLATACW
jgi:hypothetical protein